jgi:hypothetical protein
VALRWHLFEVAAGTPVQITICGLSGGSLCPRVSRAESGAKRHAVISLQPPDLEPVMNWRGVFAPEVPLGGMHSHREAQQPPIGMQLQGRSEPSRESARDCNTRRVQPSQRPAFAALSS